MRRKNASFVEMAMDNGSCKNIVKLLRHTFQNDCVHLSVNTGAHYSQCFSTYTAQMHCCSSRLLQRLAPSQPLVWSSLSSTRLLRLQHRFSGFNVFPSPGVSKHEPISDVCIWMPLGRKSYSCEVSL